MHSQKVMCFFFLSDNTLFKYPFIFGPVVMNMLRNEFISLKASRDKIVILFTENWFIKHHSVQEWMVLLSAIVIFILSCVSFALFVDDVFAIVLHILLIIAAVCGMVGVAMKKDILLFNFMVGCAVLMLVDVIFFIVSLVHVWTASLLNILVELVFLGMSVYFTWELRGRKCVP